MEEEVICSFTKPRVSNNANNRRLGVVHFVHGCVTLPGTRSGGGTGQNTGTGCRQLSQLFLLFFCSICSFDLILTGTHSRRWGLSGAEEAPAKKQTTSLSSNLELLALSIHLCKVEIWLLPDESVTHFNQILELPLDPLCSGENSMANWVVFVTHSTAPETEEISARPHPGSHMFSPR